MHMDTNHALRVLANGILDFARIVAQKGIHHGDRVPLGALPLDLSDPEEVLQLVEMHRLGFLSLHRADLTWSWREKFGDEVMDRSEVRHLTSTWHAVALRPADAKALNLF